ncbi:MAG: HAD family hydrolase [Collinsella sp.]|nr:HAD family hydrolase [Collinsella sp.]
MLKAVVFDMDETLLDINLRAFVVRLAKNEAGILAQIAGKNPFSMFALFASAMLEVNDPDRDDDLTNRDFFDDFIMRRCGVPLNDPVIADAFEYYEREVLPARNDALIGARPREGAHEAVEAVAARGLRTALFTNPCFTRSCIECRMAWGDLLDMPFELVTTMENSTRCKPSPHYYLEAASRMGLAPEEVLMVGNDPKRDFPSPDCGIKTAYVGNGSHPDALWSGSMAGFATELDAIIERFNKDDEAQEAR